MSDRVAPEERRQGHTHGSVADTQLPLKRGRDNRETAAIGIIEEHREPEERHQIWRNACPMVSPATSSRISAFPQKVFSDAKATDAGHQSGTVMAEQLASESQMRELRTNVCFGLPLQPVIATHASKRSAGVSKPSVLRAHYAEGRFHPSAPVSGEMPASFPPAGEPPISPLRPRQRSISVLVPRIRTAPAEPSSAAI